MNGFPSWAYPQVGFYTVCSLTPWTYQQSCACFFARAHRWWLHASCLPARTRLLALWWLGFGMPQVRTNSVNARLAAKPGCTQLHSAESGCVLRGSVLGASPCICALCVWHAWRIQHQCSTRLGFPHIAWLLQAPAMRPIVPGLCSGRPGRLRLVARAKQLEQLTCRKPTGWALRCGISRKTNQDRAWISARATNFLYFR